MKKSDKLFGLLFLASCSVGKPSKTPGEKDAVTVMTYNIHHANPPSKKDQIDIDAIARVINQQHPDIVALQEVDVNTRRSGMNEAVELAQKTRMNFYFARAIDYDGGQYGVAVLSKYALSEGATHRLPTMEGTGGEPRVLATVVVQINDKPVVIACTHLDAQRNDTNRIAQMNTIVGILGKEDRPVILAGDLNAAPGSKVINTLDRYFTRTCYEQCGFTIPVEKPSKTIDIISYSSANRFSIQAHRVVDEKYASDHLPVIAKLAVH